MSFRCAFENATRAALNASSWEERSETCWDEMVEESAAYDADEAV